jgi:hypothetical protein
MGLCSGLGGVSRGLGLGRFGEYRADADGGQQAATGGEEGATGDGWYIDHGDSRRDRDNVVITVLIVLCVKTNFPIQLPGVP